MNRFLLSIKTFIKFPRQKKIPLQKLGRWSNVSQGEFPGHNQYGYDCAEEFRLHHEDKVMKKERVYSEPE